MVNPKAYLGKTQAQRQEAMRSMIATGRAISVAGAIGMLIALSAAAITLIKVAL